MFKPNLSPFRSRFSFFSQPVSPPRSGRTQSDSLKDKPVLTVDAPAAWKIDWIEASVLPGVGRLQCSTEGGAADLEIKTLPNSGWETYFAMLSMNGGAKPITDAIKAAE
jgi:hypothetical protein